MKIVMAIIKPFKLDEVKEALQAAEQFLGIKLTVRARVEYGRYGSRVWRLH